MATAMAKRLEGKTIVITGASSGIGWSTAKEFARTSPKNLKFILLLSPGKERSESLLCDQLICLRSYDSGLVKGVAKSPNITAEDINIMFSTNTIGLINMTQAILPIFKKRDQGGRGDIINIGSIAGREAYPGGSVYCAAKAAVRSFSDALRKELIATRVRVIEIDPGQVETEFSIVRFYGDKSQADAVYSACEPLTPDDIAEVIVFAAGRRENVVIADTMIFPNHQLHIAGLLTLYTYQVDNSPPTFS
ncbi:hypothetical protein Egran_02426 [Elaphomyces granulatus]|uniref:Oxidoreductase n=1 Tax=Elaphomyces granulatus TaxID=519963 RepID=A0A232M075_9EURO|nr:hypothetical protein Egran_02426 [Elaphomyces granulatus]